MTLFKSGDLAMCVEMSVAAILRYCDWGLLSPVAGARSDHIKSFDVRQTPYFYVLKLLRELGLNKQEVLEYGVDHTPESVIEMLGGYEEQLSDEIAALQKRLDVVRSYLPLIREGCAAKPGIELRTLPEQCVRLGAVKNHGGKRKDVESLRRTFLDIRQYGNPGCPMGLTYNGFFDLLENPDEPAQVVSYDPQGPETRPAGEYLVGTVAAYYGEKHALPRRMSDFAMRNGLDFHGPAYTVYLLDAVSVNKTEQYLLQIAVGVKHKDEEKEKACI